MLKIILVKHYENGISWLQNDVKRDHNQIFEKKKRNNDNVRNKFSQNFGKQFSAQNKWIKLLRGALWESL